MHPGKNSKKKKKLTKFKIFWIGSSWKLQFDHVIFFGFSQACLSALKKVGDTDFEERFGPSMWIFGFKWYTVFENLQKQHGCEKSSSWVATENILDNQVA